MSVATTWGTEPHERSLAFPCDRYLDRFEGAYYRGVTVAAPAGTIFRWLCQMRIAPYSYDWIDNFGRRSPRTLTPGLDDLATGQRMMGAFELVEFERDRHVTMRTKPGASLIASKVFGETAVTYLIAPQAGDDCRLLVKLLVAYPSGSLGWALRLLLPWGDLVMMRRQLLNLKALSEQTVRAAGA